MQTRPNEIMVDGLPEQAAPYCLRRIIWNVGVRARQRRGFSNSAITDDVHLQCYYKEILWIIIIIIIDSTTIMAVANNTHNNNNNNVHSQTDSWYITNTSWYWCTVNLIMTVLHPVYMHME